MRHRASLPVSRRETALLRMGKSNAGRYNQGLGSLLLDPTAYRQLNSSSLSQFKYISLMICSLATSFPGSLFSASLGRWLLYVFHRDQFPVGLMIAPLTEHCIESVSQRPCSHGLESCRLFVSRAPFFATA